MSPGAIDDPGLLIYERVLPALAGSVTRIRGELMETLAQHDLAADRRADIALVVSEAATNAILHAYGDTTPGPLYVAATLGGESLTVWICDVGSGMLARRDSPGLGLGLGLITRLCDEVQISSDANTGTCLTVTFAGVARMAAPGGRDRTPTLGSRREILLDYLHTLRAAHTALQQDTDAVLARADLAVARARRLRHQRAHHRSTTNPA